MASISEAQWRRGAWHRVGRNFDLIFPHPPKLDPETLLDRGAQRWQFDEASDSITVSSDYFRGQSRAEASDPEDTFVDVGQDAVLRQAPQSPCSHTISLQASWLSTVLQAVWPVILTLRAIAATCGCSCSWALPGRVCTLAATCVCSCSRALPGRGLDVTGVGPTRVGPRTRRAR